MRTRLAAPWSRAEASTAPRAGRIAHVRAQPSSAGRSVSPERGGPAIRRAAANESLRMVNWSPESGAYVYLTVGLQFQRRPPCAEGVSSGALWSRPSTFVRSHNAHPASSRERPSPARATRQSELRRVRRTRPTKRRRGDLSRVRVLFGRSTSAALDTSSAHRVRPRTSPPTPDPGARSPEPMCI